MVARVPDFETHILVLATWVEGELHEWFECE